MKELITTFPLGFVATVTPEGTPAVSPKGTFLVMDDQTLAYGDIRSPGTRYNLQANPVAEVNFVDPFKRKAVRAAGTVTINRRGTDWYDANIARWFDIFGDLSKRITALVAIRLTSATEIWTPPYDDGVTEGEMIATYVARFGALYP